MNEDVLKKFDEIAAQWEAEDPGSTDIETPPHGSTEHETVLPGLDLSEGQQPQEPVPSETKAEPPEPPSDPWARVKFEMNQQKTAKPSSSDLESKMQSVGWAPKERSGPPDYEKLLSDIQAAEHGGESLKTVGAMLHAAAPGFEAPSNPGAGEIAAAKAPLEVEQQRQAMEAKQQAADEERLVAGKKARLDDPSSAESKRAQAEVKDMFPDSRRVPSGLEQMSANELAQLRPSLVTLTGQDSTAATAKGRDDAAATAKAAAEKAKADAGVEKLTQENTVVEGLRAAAKKSPRLAELGLKPEDLDRYDRKALEDLDKNLRDLPNKKAGTGTGAAVHIVPGDFSTVPEGERATVQAIADGREKAPDPGSRFGQKILSYVNAVKPDFDATRFGAYKAVVEHQATDKDIVAAETAQKHIKHAREIIPDNFDSQFMNRIRTAVLTGEGAADLTPFQTTVKVAADEYAKGLGNNAQSGRQEIEHILAPVQSKAQLVAALDTIDSLLASKQETWKEQLAKKAPKGSASVKTWKNKKTGRTTQGTAEQLKSSKNPDDWEEAPGG